LAISSMPKMPSTVRKNLPNLQLPLRLSDKHFRQTSKLAYSITPIQREQYIAKAQSLADSRTTISPLAYLPTYKG